MTGNDEGFAGTAGISCSIGGVLREITKETTPARIWKILETLYMTKSLANYLYLKRKFYTFQMYPGKSQSEHIDEFYKLVGDLMAIDTAILVRSFGTRSSLRFWFRLQKVSGFAGSLIFNGFVGLGFGQQRHEKFKQECRVLEVSSFRSFKVVDVLQGFWVYKNRFEKVRMKALLLQQVLAAALEELPATTIVVYDNVIQKKAYNALILYLGDRVLQEITKETTDTLKLEDVHTTLNSREVQKMTKAKGDGGEGLYVRGRSGRRDIKQDTDSAWDCPRRDYFVDFEEYDGGKILLGDGKECRIRGTGTLEKEGGFYREDASGQSKVLWAEDTTMSTYLVNRLPSSTIRFKTLVDVLGRGSVKVLQRSEFEVVDRKRDHTLRWKPHGECRYVEWFTGIACKVISKWKAGLKDDMDARSSVYMLNNGCKKCSDDSDGYYREYTPSRKAHLLEDKQIPSVGIFDEVFSTLMAFGGNTLTRDGVTGIKRCRRDLYSDGVRNLAMMAGRGPLKEDLESSTWRRRQDF
ncbi:hypothetical protein Tco_0681896 [Tanacetum coccineum]|uniref:Uncharacterized protein n=1 Tax=Tanacetum coccineum TaxID=301880 RepID=A0ABQ4XR89_9ASTR